MWHIVQDVLNSLGLPLLAAGLFIVYLALARKNKLLLRSVDDLKTVHSGLVEVVRTREEQFRVMLDERDDLAAMYRKMIDDAGGHGDKLKQSMAGAIETLESQLRSEREALVECRRSRQQLESESDNLQRRLSRLQALHTELEERYEKFVIVKYDAR